METAFNGYFFFFLAKSSIDEVGSDPADNKKRIGSNELEPSQILSIGYDKGVVNSLPKTFKMKLLEETRVLSSLIDLTKQTESKDPISFSAIILSWKSGIG